MYIASVYLQNVHDDPQGPDVTRLVVLLRPEHLRGRVVRSVAGGLQFVLDDRLFGKTEIRELQHTRAVRPGVEEVLRLEVPVGDIAVVEELHGQADVLHDLGRLCKSQHVKYNGLNALP